MIRTIPWQDVVEAVAELCIAACYELDPALCRAFEQSRQTERSACAQHILGQLLDNARIAREERIPLCQDTGFAVVFVEQGNRCVVKACEGNPGATLTDAVNEGVRRGYERGLLRQSIVAEPLKERKNTQTNTPAVVHHEWVAGEGLKLTVLPKGGGCENRCAMRILKPTAGAEAVKDFVVETVLNAGADACPPFVVGVGIGGTFEKCATLSKKALLREMGSRHEDAFYAELEDAILRTVNASGIGPGGFGGDTTALAVFIETFGCHIASLPVAVTMECHSHRHKSCCL